MSVNMEVIEKESTVADTVTDTVGDTVTDTVTDTVVPPEEEQASGAETNRPLLVDIPVDNENTALNLLVGFLNVAQRRGTFNFKESAKIGECIEMFVKGQAQAPGQ